jgi:exosortase family protein XrtG
MKYIIGAVFILIWIYVLGVLRRTGLQFWRYIIGAFGLFIFMMIWLRPVLVQPLSRIVAAIAGVVGTITGTFTTYFKYGIIFIESSVGSLTLNIDFECSGIIEIMAFLSLLVFFRVYTRKERVLIGIVGTLYIILANALRIIVICEMIYFGGVSVYYIAHSFVGRIVFYALSVLLYFYVFTKPQIIRIQIGDFKYGDDKQVS